MNKRSWRGRNVLILGAARQGAALARWLSKQGSNVTLSDVRSEEALADARRELADLPIMWQLGGHPLELLEGKDLVCLSGGVPADLPIVDEARRRGIELSNDTQIFLENVPCTTVGITGSAGKTTTTALVGAMAQAAYPDHAASRESGDKASPPSAFVGGNIGDPLLNHLDAMDESDVAILEISSFQLEQMTVSPNVAAVLNITPNHLDRHHTMESYTAAKTRILEFQRPTDRAVLGHDDPGAWALRSKAVGRLDSFGLSRIEDGRDGTYYDGGILYLSDRGVEIPLLQRKQLLLRGDHNLLNVLAAFAIGHAAGLPLDAMLEAAEQFRGMPHRLELIRELHGVAWYDDSIATAPERVAAAIRAFNEPLVLLLGGRDKNLPWESLAKLVHERAVHAILFGEAAGKIRSALETSNNGANEAKPERRSAVHMVRRMQEAVVKAHQLARPGDVVLLSPGGTSFDEFKDFEDRGDRFQSWIHELT
jgi:UDP-N-acetylmuramoylalanine--D-glutamate ligase